MGRIDAVLEDKLEERFRMEAARRYGLKKGVMLRAISEAIDSWTTTDESRNIARKTAKTVRDKTSSTGVKQHAVDLLASMGLTGRELLSDIANDPKVPDSIREQAFKAMSAQSDR